jgi:hypothetical protein
MYKQGMGDFWSSEITLYDIIMVDTWHYASVKTPNIVQRRVKLTDFSNNNERSMSVPHCNDYTMLKKKGNLEYSWGRDENSVLSAQVFYKPKTALKNTVYFKKFFGKR